MPRSIQIGFRRVRIHGFGLNKRKARHTDAHLRLWNIAQQFCDPLHHSISIRLTPFIMTAMSGIYDAFAADIARLQTQREDLNAQRTTIHVAVRRLEQQRDHIDAQLVAVDEETVLLSRDFSTNAILPPPLETSQEGVNRASIMARDSDASADNITLARTHANTHTFNYLMHRMRSASDERQVTECHAVPLKLQNHACHQSSRRVRRARIQHCSTLRAFQALLRWSCFHSLT